MLELLLAKKRGLDKAQYTYIGNDGKLKSMDATVECRICATNSGTVVLSGEAAKTDAVLVFVEGLEEHIAAVEQREEDAARNGGYQ